MTRIFLCRVDEFADPGTRNVVLGEGEDALDIIIVQTKGTRHAYVNCCPHQFIPLETFPNHFFTEDMGIAEIARARIAFEQGNLRAKLARLHADPANAFHNWCDPWLLPDFRKWDLSDALAHIRVPVLIVQGENDQYGTIKQIEVAQEECYCPVEVALLPDTRHAPYREAPAATLAAISDFANRLLRDHHEGDIAHTELGPARVRSL